MFYIEQAKCSEKDEKLRFYDFKKFFIVQVL
jgi:hypothetical protein